MAGRGSPAIWRKEKMVWVFFGGNLINDYAGIMPINVCS
jgi:hypothetical protein